ncbi:hypothetical protein DY000_02002235 [Brassica cretica]|uniref:Uncharacterized protein n=1 Tax=Brassica cretica TaxID=69181 RepID=A0ABQ7BUG3_BRACR|nr:hypothetical protein DY000_02002235 [Brassica cretica]
MGMVLVATIRATATMANPHEPHFLKPLLPHEGDMVFHVTPFGPSCCEIQYTHPHIIKEEAEADDAADDAAGDADDNEHHHKIISSCGSYEFYCFEQTMPRDDTSEQRGKFMDCEFAI